MKSFSIILLIAVAPLVNATDLYKWRDSEGHVHYTDQPPPPSAKAIERKSGKGNLIESDTLPFETKLVARKYPVTLYSFPECGDPCSSGEALLAKRGIPFTLKNQEEDKAVLVKLTGESQAPVLIVGNQSPLKGYQESKWNELLDLAGYPKSNPLGNLKNQPALTQKPVAAPAKDR